MQPPHRQRKDANRERILQATLELAQEEGWAGITMRRIADRVQYTHPALYGYFATKQDLYTALLQRGLQLLGQRLEAAQTSTDDPLAAFKAIADAYWSFAWEQPELYQVMHGLGGVAFTTADLRADERRIGESAAAVIRQLLQARELDDAEINRKVVLVWSTIHGLITLTMAGRFDRAEGDALLDQMVRDSLVAWGVG